jgi:lipoprotein NlpI
MSKKKKSVKNKTPKKPNTIQKGSAKKATTPAKTNTNVLAGIAVAIAILTFFFYRGSLDNQFVDWDDYPYVIDNNLVRSQHDMSTVARFKNQAMLNKTETSEYTTTIGDIFTKPVSLNYHPLTILTMRWNNNATPDVIHNISARPFIQWNIILHILNSILVLLLIYWFTKGNIWASTVVAAIFAWHPMHVESVAWVSERKDVLYTFFLLLGLLAYTQYLAKFSSKWLAITLGCFILSCLSKAMAVIFPLLLLLMAWWDEKEGTTPIESIQKTIKTHLLTTLPFFAISLFFGVMASKVQAGGNFLGMLQVATDTSVAINDFDTFTLIQRFQFASYGFLHYIGKFFVPTDMAAFHAYPTTDAYEANYLLRFSPLIVLLIFSLVAYSLKFTKIVAAGIGFYFITVMLVLQFVSVGVVITADRYTYIPYIGLALLLVLTIMKYAPTNLHQPIWIGLLLGSFGLGFITTQQIETWQDSETLWTTVIEKHRLPDGSLPQTMEQPLSIRGSYYGKMADHYRIKGNMEKSKVLLDKAFNDFVLAEKMGSQRAEVYEGLGSTYGMRNELDKALVAISKAIELKPENGSAYFNRGVTYSMLSQHQKAIQDYSKSLELSPSTAAMAYTYRGISYLAIGQQQKALSDLGEALKREPNNQVAKKYYNQLTKRSN